MGLLSGFMGNASEVTQEILMRDYARLLIEGEHIEMGFKLIRDVFIFTNKRLLLVNVQGLTGSKIEYQSVIYKSISRFSVESAGSFDLDAELKIWISSNPEPCIEKQFNKSVDVYQVQRILAKHIIG